MELNSRGVLMISKGENGMSRERSIADTVSVYQYARRNYDHLTLTGEGEGAAYCLMLAGRFMPDEVVIAPVSKTKTPDDFFISARSLVKGLYAVCAKIEVHLPSEMDMPTERRFMKMLREIRSDSKRVVRYESETEIDELFETMAKRGRMIKTLA